MRCGERSPVPVTLTAAFRRAAQRAAGFALYSRAAPPYLLPSPQRSDAPHNAQPASHCIPVRRPRRPAGRPLSSAPLQPHPAQKTHQEPDAAVPDGSWICGLLFVPQRLDGVEVGGLVGGVVAEEQADGHGEAHRQRDGAHRRQPGEAQVARRGIAQYRAQ